ncbi:MAG: hypothetical protein ABJF04_13685 [Reichenbachiella sp.]|uniref:hypothetical protein n=1 Tax=Reichenbachiella sp. TaxID=2184521 RepID=UPI0032653100
MASPTLLIHISAGAIGLLSGAAALVFHKGSRLHGKAGNVFFLSMLVMSASGAYIAYDLPKALSVLNGLLTFYLVATSWVTIRRKERETGLFEIGGFLVALSLSVGLFTFGLEAANSGTGLKHGFSAGAYYFFGLVAALSAVLDMSVIIRGGVSGSHRIVRHLWRMCFAMWIATTSLFLGQPQLFPTSVRESQILFVPVLAVVLSMFFWLFRALFTKKYKKRERYR